MSSPIHTSAKHKGASADDSKLDAIDRIIIDAIHKQSLKDTAQSLLSDPSCQSDAKTQDLLETAIATCNAIQGETRAIQKQLMNALREAEVTAIPVSNSSTLQYHYVQIRVNRDQVDRAIQVCAKHGFQLEPRHSAGAWECQKRFQTKSLLVKGDSNSTRLSLSWDPHPVFPNLPRQLRPAAPEFDSVSFPKPLWWLYPIFRAFRRLRRNAGPKNQNAQQWPFLGTPTELIPQLLEFAGVNKDDTLVDLGCGDGRILIEAARLIDCRCIGIERDPELARVAQRRVSAAHFSERVTIRCGDVSDFNVNDATAVFLFLPARSIPKLVASLSQTLKPGTRIVAHEQAEIQDVSPTLTKPLLSRSGITVAHLWRL